jgi:pyridoxal phosphate enzyme (YggS family)
LPTPGSLEADVRGRLAAIRAAIADAAARAGRDVATIRIVAVTKTFPAAAVVEALAAGLSDVGESYVQEARRKRDAVAGGTWHLIGGLQRNKARAAVRLFDRVHTVDGAALAAALAAEADRGGRRLPVLVQVNVGGEDAKRGVAPDAAIALAEAVLRHPALALDGLMTIPPAPRKPADSRPYFRILAELRRDAEKRLGVELPHLSMGMSDDFPIAVEEGATLLRLGRALFGARGPGASRPGSSGGGEGS